MTISANDRKIVYTGNGSTTTFSYNFPVALSSDLLVTLKSTANVYTVQALTTHYTATVTVSGGVVTFLTAPASGYAVIIESRTPRTQATDYVEGDRFPANTHEAALDKLTKIDQEQDGKLARAITLGPDLSVNPVIASTAAGYVLRINSSNTGVEAVAPGIAGSVTDTVPIELGGTGATTASAARSSLGLAIGTDVQAFDSELAALAGVTSAADTVPYFTGSGTASVSSLTSFARTVLDDVDAPAVRTTLGLGTMSTQAASSVSITGGTIAGATITGGSITGMTDIAVADGGTGASTAAGARTNLGLVIGTDVQAYDAELAALASVTSAADKVPYFTGSGTASVADLSSFGRTLIDDADASTARTTLGLAIGTNVQAYDADLAALASAGSGSDTMPYYTGIGAASTTGLTSYARSLLDDSSASAMRTTLGLAIGSNVQAFDATLSSLAAYNTNGVLVQTAADTFAGRTITSDSASQILVTNGDGVAGNPTLGLPDFIILPGGAGGSAIGLSEATVNGTNVVALASPSSLSSNLVFILPSADGSSGQALVTNGSGSLSFGSPTAAAGGSTTQIQYNSSGVLTGSSWLTYDGTDDITFRNSTSTVRINVGGATNGGYVQGSESGCAIVGNSGASVQAAATANGGVAYTALGTGGHVFNVATSTHGMSLLSSGKLSIGTNDTSNALIHVRPPSGFANPTVTATFRVASGQTDGNIYFDKSAGGAVGGIFWNATSTTYSTSSDYRLKKDVVPMEDGLDKILLIKPCYYSWIYDNSPGQGFLAHELQEHIPQAVRGTKDQVDEQGNAKHQSIDYSLLTPTLVSAIKALHAKIQEMQEEIDILKAGSN